MKKHIYQFAAMAIMATCSLQLMAKPAKPGLREVSNADGSTITVRLAGDEFYHQYFTEDGYPLCEEDGNFYYCDIAPDGKLINSGIKAANKSARSADAVKFISDIDKAGLEQRIQKRASLSPRRASMATSAQKALKSAPSKSAGEAAPPYEQGYGLFSGTHFPSHGEQKGLVVLVQYTDTKFTLSNPHDYFSRMLNEPGFSDYKATGSAVDFFRENSQDAFRPQFDVYGPITLANNMAYYGANDAYGDDVRPHLMAVEACEQLDDTVDFSQYDRDGDGYIDNVFVFYAGKGEASGGSKNTVWPHAWNVENGLNYCPEYDGVKLSRYACSNEWEDGRPDGVGTFVHEFSHVMGLPDLYATSYTSSFTPGSWSCMDMGPYNNDGMTPPYYGAFERYALGWIKPREVKDAVSAVLEPISENVCGIIRTAKNTEFFLLENRQQAGWDKYVPGHGMLVWHVDFNQTVWASNKVNNTPSHQYVDIEEADGTQTAASRAGDAFPGTAHKTTFTGTTTPAMKTWTGTKLEYPITNIAENGGIITFDVLDGALQNVPACESTPAEEISAEGFTATWKAEDGYEYLLSVYTKTPQGEQQQLTSQDGKNYLPALKNRNVGSVSSWRVEGVEADTDYYYTVTATTGWNSGEPSEEITVTTGRHDISYFAPTAVEATDITSNSFTANWNELENATGYFLSVYEQEYEEPYVDTCDFANGKVLPEGWTSSSSNTYANAAYCGQAVPSMRLNESGQQIASPEYEDGVTGISYWSRGNGTTIDSKIYVIAVTSSGDKKIAEFPIETTVGGVINEFREFPANTKQVMLKYVSPTGAVAIDDIVVEHGEKYTYTPLENYEEQAVGNVLSSPVTGLNPYTQYVYEVYATDGDLLSKTSKRISVRTEPLSSIDNIAAVSSGISINGRTLVSTSNSVITVADLTGKVVGHATGKVVIPDAGLYIVSIPSEGIKMKITVK